MALLTVPAISSAHPLTRSFRQAYPHASRLCLRVERGHAPKALKASTTQVTDACNTLKSGYTDAQNAFATTVAPLRAQAVAARQAARQSCMTDPSGCKQARQGARATIATLRGQVKSAAITYHIAVESGRKTFWTTIRSLRGGSTITPDTTSPAAPTVALPSV